MHVLKFAIASAITSMALAGPISAQQRAPIGDNGIAQYEAYVDAMCREGTYEQWGYPSSDACGQDLMSYAPNEGVPYDVIRLPNGVPVFHYTLPVG